MKKIKDQISDVLNENQKSIQISQRDICKVETLLVQAQNILIGIVETHGEDSEFGKLVQNETLPMLERLLTDQPGSI